MFQTCLVKIVIVSFVISQVSGKYCQSIASICDCSYTHHNLLWNTHNIHCPKQINGSAYDYTVKLIDTLSVEVECHNGSVLRKLPVLNLNTHLYKVEFRNCFRNDRNVTNERFELNHFMVNQLNVKIYKTINIVFHESAPVEEKTFFNNLQVSNIWNLKVENVQFETCEVLQNCYYLRVLNFTNTNFVDFKQLNQTGCNGLRIFVVRNTNTVKNLNAANLAKIGNVQELKIYNSDIVDYYEQMYKDGAVFINLTALKYLVLESTFNNLEEKILLNETLLQGVDLFSLSLTDLKLEELPSKLLRDQRALRLLYLNRNLLTTIDVDLLKNCRNLRLIDLSNNMFVRFSDTSIFSNIATLNELRLSYNQLEAFKFNLNSNYNLTKILLDHNYIKTEGDTCPITGIRNRETTIDLSFNLITKSRPIIECLNSNKELKSLDVSNNQMIDLAFDDALPYGRAAIFKTRVNFANNKITYLDFLSYREVNRSVFRNEVNIHLDSNPVFCHNCLNIKKMFRTKTLHYAINQTMFKVHHPTECLSSTPCLITNIDSTFKCPSPCDCLYNEYTKILIVDCEYNNLTSIPFLNASNLLKYNVEKVQLQLQFNQLTRISFANVSSELIKKLDTINLENNQIESINFDPFNFPNNLTVLKLASNRISEIDEPTMNLLNSRKYYLSVTLVSNPIVSSNESFKKLNQIHKFKIANLMEIREALKMKESQEHLDKPSKSSGVGLLFGGILMLFIVVIAGIVMMYTYRRYGGPAIFQRLREQRATSEMVLGGFQDD